MTTIEELVEKLTGVYANSIQQMAEIIKEYAGSKKSEAVEPDYGLWKPKERKTYWFINDMWELIYDSIWDNMDTDNFRYSIGNCFRTREEAEKALEHLKIRRQLKDIAARLNKGRNIDWNNFKEQKWYLMYSYPQNTILKDFTDTVKLQGGIYCLDENFKDVAIAEIGEERLRNYLKEC